MLLAASCELRVARCEMRDASKEGSKYRADACLALRFEGAVLTLDKKRSQTGSFLLETRHSMLETILIQKHRR